MLVDSHCHLNFPNFRDDLDGVVARAREAGVGVMQTICTEMAEFEEVRGIARRYENIYCSVGVHPNESGAMEIVSSLDLLEKTSYPEVIGIGETGLDYHYPPSLRSGETSEKNYKDIQKQSFIEHIKAARETCLPLIVHTRDADEDTVNILSDEMTNGKFKGLIHCFTSSRYLAEKVIELGFFISLSGIISFKNAGSIRDAIADVPLERLLVETDAPYLAPVPHRGKRNEPSFIKYTNKILSELKQITEEECARITSDNFFRLFDKAKPL